MISRNALIVGTNGLIILCALLTTISLITPALATGHTSDYWYGFKVGKRDGSGGVYDSGDACQNGVASLYDFHYHSGSEFLPVRNSSISYTPFSLMENLVLIISVVW